MLKSEQTFSPDISKENSFDFLRLLFAFSVFVAHFHALTGSFIISWPITSIVGVAGFFVISGFLITRSYYRCSGLWDYANKRIRRIVPAYVLVVLACACLLSLLSQLPLSEYFTEKDWYKYLLANLSFLNFLQPTLPGVFADNPIQAVNGSLWTIKVELSLYALVPILALFMKRRPIIALVTAYIASFVFIRWMMNLYTASGNELYLILQRQFVGQAQYFVAGIILLFYFDFIIRKEFKWFLLIALLVIITRQFASHWSLQFIYPFFLAVLVVGFAYYCKHLSIVSKYGDCSYGFYLFHFPVVQVFVSLGWLQDKPVLLFVVCFFVILFLSFLSWHLLEKRLLKRNRK